YTKAFFAFCSVIKYFGIVVSQYQKIAVLRCWPLGVLGLCLGDNLRNRGIGPLFQNEIEPFQEQVMFLNAVVIADVPQNFLDSGVKIDRRGLRFDRGSGRTAALG